MIIPSEVRMAATLLSAAALITGCCGPKRDGTAMRYQSSPSGVAYSETSPGTTTESVRTDLSEAPAPATTEERTRVRSGDTEKEWALPLYSEELRVGKREVENASVRLRKTVRTETANQPIELKRETVVIDREAFEKARQAANEGRPNEFGAAFEEKEIVIDLKREEPVVEVQSFLSGRIVADKRVTTERQTVSRPVRHEDVEIIKSGNERDIVVSERLQAESNRNIGAPAAGQDRQVGGSTERDVKVRDNSTGVEVDRKGVKQGTIDNQKRIPAKGGSADLQPNKTQTDKTRD